MANEKTLEQIKQIQRALLDKNPQWPQEKARWIAARSLFG